LAIQPANSGNVCRNSNSTEQTPLAAVAVQPNITAIQRVTAAPNVAAPRVVEAGEAVLAEK